MPRNRNITTDDALRMMKKIGTGGGGSIAHETDPTVPSWAKQPTKPTYTAAEVGARPATWTPSASDVGADPSGTANSMVSGHNTNTAAHNDIRLLIEGLTTRLNALANSDDTTLDQMAEVVAYIKANRTLIESVTTDKVNVADIIDDLETNVSNKPLSAAQGARLYGLIQEIWRADYATTAWVNRTLSLELANYVSETELTNKGYAKQTDVDGLSEEIADLKNQISGVNYTNVITTAVDVDGNPYNGGKGYKTGYRYSTSSATEVAHSAYCCTGFIPITPNSVIRIKNITVGSAGSGSVMLFYEDKSTTNRPVAFYEEYFDDCLENGVYTISATEYPSLADSNIAFFTLSTGLINDNTIITINEEITENSGGNSEDEPTITETDVVEILMPSYAVATVGVEFNIYHKNIVWANKPLDCYGLKWTISNTSVGIQRLSECLRITPTTANVGVHTLKLQVKNPISNAVVAEQEMTLRIVERTAVTGKNVVYMGDSLTYSRHGLYPAEIQYNLSSGGIVSVGTQAGTQATNQIGAVNHEGYNGATCGGFLQANIVSGYTNPFYNTTSKTFDFAQFVNTVGKSVHAVCLNLGANNLGNQVQGVADLQTIISKIRAYSSNLPIIVSLAPPTAGQDSWRNGTFTATEMRWHWRNLIKAFIEAFDNKLPNVYISTPYFNVDSDNDFPTETVARCSRDTTQISRQNDSLHPTRIGTLKMADSYYATLLYILSQGYVPEEPEPVVANLVDPTTANDSSPDTTTLFKDEWLNGYYLSASSISAKAGCIVTNIFPHTKEQTLKIEGVLLNTAEQKNRFRWYHFDASGSRPFPSYINYANGENVVSSDVVTIDATNNTITVKCANANTYSRFSCYIAGSVEDVKVTVVE